MKKAFSLAELLVVLAIISIVIGTMKVSIQHKRLQANAKAIVECIKVYEAAITMYYLRNGGAFPPDANGQVLEDVPALYPYCPAGFNTTEVISGKNVNSIAIDATGGNYGIKIFVSGEEGGKVLNEVIKQLKEFALESQFNQGAFSVPPSYDPGTGQSSGGETRRYFTFCLKKGDTVYI